MAFSTVIPDIIAGLVSAQSETHGWNNDVVAALLANPSSVVRTSNTVVTITLPAVATYDITATETITVTIPASALAGGSPLVATPTFRVDPVVALTGASGTGAVNPPGASGATTTVLVAPLGTNLILQSEAFDQSPWLGGSVIVTANSTLAPDGTTTADTLTQASADDSRGQQFTVPPSGVVNFSVDLKQSVGSTQYLTVSDTGSGATAHCGIFWSGGIPSVSTLGNSAGASSGGFSAVLAPNGFYRVSYWVAGLTGGHTGQIFVHPSSSIGTNGDAVVAWGVQVSEGTGLLPYFKTTTVPAAIIAGAWGTGAVNGLTATVAASVTPTAVAGTGSVNAPSVRGDVTKALSAASGAGAVNAPTAAPTLTVSLSAAAGTGAVQAPTVRGDVAITPSAAAGTGAVSAPSVTSGLAVSPAGATGTGAVHGPTVRGDAMVSLSAVSGSGAINAPSTSPLVPAAPGSAAGTGAVNSPTVSGSASVTPASLAGTGQVHVPTVVPSLSVAVPSVAGTGSASPIASGFQGAIAAIIAGLTSDQSETHGWNAEVKAALLANPSSVVRTSDTVVTITLPAVPLYDITALETITATIPGSALAGGLPIVAAPTFSVGLTPVQGVAATGAVNAPSLILDYLSAVMNAAATGVPHAPIVRGDVSVPLGSVLGVNLILQSEALDQAPWYGTGATVTANAVTAPDGTLSGDRLTRATNANDFWAQDVTFLADGSWVASVSLKQETSALVDLELFDWTSAVIRHRVSVTWVGGVPVVSHVSGSGLTFHEVLAQPNGWYRVGFTATGLIAASQNSLIILPSPAGSNGDTVSVWGAEVTAGSTLLPYAKTTAAPANIVGGVSGRGVANPPTGLGNAALTLSAVTGTGSVHAPAPVIGTVKALIGVTASGAVHAPVAAPGVAVSLSGVAGSAAVNPPSLGTNATVGVGSVSGTGAIHAPNARGDATVALLGVAATAVPHAPSTGTIIDASVTPGSVAGMAAVNPPTVAGDVTVAVPNVAATATANDVAVSGDVSVVPATATGTGAVNAPFVGFTVTQSTAAGTGAVNAPTVVTARVVAVTGAAGSGVVHAPSVRLDYATTLSGVAAAGAVNAPTMRGDASIPVGSAAGVGAVLLPTVNLNSSVSAPISPAEAFAVVNGPTVHIDETLAVGSASGTGAVNQPSALPSLQVPVSGASASGIVQTPSADLQILVALATASGTGAANAPTPANQINTTVSLGSVAGTGAANDPVVLIVGLRQFRTVVFADVVVSRSLLTDVTVTRSLFTDVEVLPEGP